jgi:hypothetical protein
VIRASSIWGNKLKHVARIHFFYLTKIVYYKKSLNRFGALDREGKFVAVATPAL